MACLDKRQFKRFELDDLLPGISHCFGRYPRMGTGYKLKGKALNLFAKLKPNDESNNSGPDITSRLSSSSSRSSSPSKAPSPTKITASGAPPRGPRAPGQARSDPDSNPTQLAESLNELSLNEQLAPTHADPSYGRVHERFHNEEHSAPQNRHTNPTLGSTGPFIGGFAQHVPPQYGSPQGTNPGPLPRPPAMQFPAAVVDQSLAMQYAHQPPPLQQYLIPHGGQADYGIPPSRPYSAPAPPGYPHPNSSPYPSPRPSPAYTPGPAYPTQQYPGPISPSISTPNYFPAPQPPPPSRGGRPLPNPGAASYAPSSTRPVVNTQFSSPSAGPTKQSKPGRLRASSTPPTPVAGVSGVSGQIQCNGITKAGKRCTRLVKGGPALANVWGTGSSTTENVERFCFQHAKELLGPSGFYARKQHRDGQQSSGIQEWIDFADYIPPYLHPDTQVALRVEMEKPRSQSDVEGFIYTFEIRNPKDPSPPVISLKVGRAVNVVKRMNQWGKQCGSKEQVLRGWYPGEVDNESDDANDTVGQSLMKGRVKAGGRGVYCHRLERLIHLELADLAVHMPYLQPGWEAFTKGSGRGKTYLSAHLEYASDHNPVASNPSASISVISLSSSSSNSPPSSPISTPVKGKKGQGKPAPPIAAATKSKSPARSKKDRFLANGLGNGGGGEPCKDCGQIHKEIFEFARVPKGPKGKKGMKKHVDYYGMEWEGIVKKVIEEWGAFVSNYV